MIRILACCCLLVASFWAAAAATAPAELKLLDEHPVAGMVGGNLSGLALCGGTLMAVSDRDDDRLYRLDTRETLWQATAEPFVAPAPPATDLSWRIRLLSWVAGFVRGGWLDLEGITCDAAGNRYLLSEAYIGVLRVDPAGHAEWLELPDYLLAQAQARKLLLAFNALYEGLAIDPQGERLWLAAERQQRGLLRVQWQGDRWQCHGRCVLLSESKRQLPPPILGKTSWQADFSDLVFFSGKLFTLERAAHLVCRRDAGTGRAERCWSYADTAMAEPRRYAEFNGAEALWIDADGAWVGVDNNENRRNDGEDRPIVWHFAVPDGGWGARL